MVQNSCCFLGHPPKWLRVCRMRLIYEDGETLTSSKYLSVHSYILIHGENHIFHICELQYSLTYDSFGPLGYPLWGLGTWFGETFLVIWIPRPLIQWIATGSTGCFRKPQMRLTFTKGVQHICLGGMFCFICFLHSWWWCFPQKPPPFYWIRQVTSLGEKRKA